CKNCAQNLIAKTEMSAGAKPMDGDNTVTTSGCAVRTFTCKGNTATIEVFGDGAILGSKGDDGTGTSTFTVTCNGAGTAWMADGQTVARVECSAVPACKMCAQDLITKTEMAVDSKPMKDDVTDPWGACAVRTFTCEGIMAIITPSTMNGVLMPVGDGGMTTMYTVTCNAAGTGWENAGQVITEVECTATPLCKTCDAAQPMITKDDVDSKDMMVPPVVNTGVCSMKTFVCEGMMATITPMSGGAPIGALTDGSMMIMYTVTCKADGSGWEVGGQVIDSVECTATPPCQQCKMEQTMVTQIAPNSKPMTNDHTDITGACAKRTFTCDGKMPKI
ncbi:hypothetical protein PMAYCL1PPCAC_22880, partial [Pristionchus mayeri]